MSLYRFGNKNNFSEWLRYTYGEFIICANLQVLGITMPFHELAVFFSLIFTSTNTKGAKNYAKKVEYPSIVEVMGVKSRVWRVNNRYNLDPFDEQAEKGYMWDTEPLVRILLFFRVTHDSHGFDLEPCGRESCERRRLTRTQSWTMVQWN